MIDIYEIYRDIQGVHQAYTQAPLFREFMWLYPWSRS